MSFLGYIWEKQPINQDLLNYLENKYKLGNISNILIAQRNINISDIENFLTPKIKSYMPDPFHLLDMEKAITRTIQAISNNENIFILADYDVDGATSSACLQRFFSDVNIKTQIYIPDRIKEGYGPSPEIVRKLKDKGAQLLFTLDCGSTAYEAMHEAKSLDIDVIVVDHHICKELAQDAYAVINPNRFDETSNMGNLAAAGVTFLFITALYIKMRDANILPKNINIFSYLDLIALGTICDVVSLTGLNRALVKQGLKIANTRNNKGLDALCKISSINDDIACYHMGFILGPRINAGGRVGKASLGSELLTTQCSEQALEIAQQLNHHNQHRQQIEADILTQALGLAEASADEDIIYLAEENWHLGVIGIIASRVKDLHHKPAIIIAVKDGIGKASCRSVEGFDIGSCVSAAVKMGLLIAGGGHAMAAGFTVEEEKIEPLKEFFMQEIKKLSIPTTKKINYNIDLELGYVNMSILEEIDLLSPFGQGNPEPIFKLPKAEIISHKKIGDKHISFILKNDNIEIPAIAFNAQKNNLLEAITDYSHAVCIGTFKLNIWLGNKKLQFFVQDIIKA